MNDEGEVYAHIARRQAIGEDKLYAHIARIEGFSSLAWFYWWQIADCLPVSWSCKWSYWWRNEARIS